MTQIEDVVSSPFFQGKELRIGDTDYFTRFVPNPEDNPTARAVGKSDGRPGNFITPWSGFFKLETPGFGLKPEGGIAKHGLPQRCGLRSRWCRLKLPNSNSLSP
jgi:hypothetical protein